MPGPRTLVVVNPNAQNGKLGRTWHDVAATLRRELGSFEDARTEGPLDATRICAEALADGFDRIVGIGGDGTVNEVINGFFDGTRNTHPDAEFALIPYGTGGDFRKTLGLPKDIGEAARAIASGTVSEIDIGHLIYRPDGGGLTDTAECVFANIASFGMSGRVVELVNQSSKRLGGRISFLWATARAGIGYQPPTVRLVFDGDEQGAVDMEISTVAVANARYFGGGMLIAPDADMCDGKFDVVAIEGLGVKDFLLSGHRLYRGTHVELDQVSVRRAQTVRAEATGNAEVRLDVDGEGPGSLPATFQILPRALRVVTPKPL